MANNISDRIIKLRKALNMSQEALAERIGVSRQAISKWERGEATPDIYNITALVGVFGMTIDEFMHGEEADLKRDQPKIVAIELKKKAELLIMIAIAMFVITPFGFNALPFSEEVNILIFGIMITIAILIVVKGGFMFERFYMYNRDNTRQEEKLDNHLDVEQGENFNMHSYTKQSKNKKNAVITLVALLCVIVYFYISFVHNLWHPGWIVFLLIPIANVVYDIFATNRGSDR